MSDMSQSHKTLSLEYDENTNTSLEEKKRNTEFVTHVCPT